MNEMKEKKYNKSVIPLWSLIVERTNEILYLKRRFNDFDKTVNSNSFWGYVNIFYSVLNGMLKSITIEFYWEWKIMNQTREIRAKFNESNKIYI